MLTKPRVSRFVMAVLVQVIGGAHPPQLLAQPGKMAGDEQSDNGLKMKFCWCPPGKFTMGSPQSAVRGRVSHCHNHRLPPRAVAGDKFRRAAGPLRVGAVLRTVSAMCAG